jgi:hypothetical protein
MLVESTIDLSLAMSRNTFINTFMNTAKSQIVMPHVLLPEVRIEAIRANPAILKDFGSK